MRCLKIQDRWICLILDRRKTWEIRRTNTRARERIGLGNTTTKRCVGYARIGDSIEMTVEDLKAYNNKHQANDFLEEYANGRKTLFAWVLEDIVVEPRPKLYSYSTGCWCKVKR